MQSSGSLHLGSLWDLVLKVPADRGRTDIDKYVRRGLTDPQDIRRNEKLERFQNLERTTERFPEFKATRESFGEQCPHFLLVHRFQRARLREVEVVGLPDSRFVVPAWPRWLFGLHTAPVIVQQRIPGVQLCDMVEPMDGVFLSRYFHLRPQLKRQVAPLVESAISIHIDWKIQNFIWQEVEQRLYHVHSKPTTLGSKFSVDRNLTSLGAAADAER